jgi:hypothetical protein
MKAQQAFLIRLHALVVRITRLVKMGEFSPRAILVVPRLQDAPHSG